MDYKPLVRDTKRYFNLAREQQNNNDIMDLIFMKKAQLKNYQDMMYGEVATTSSSKRKRRKRQNNKQKQASVDIPYWGDTLCRIRMYGFYLTGKMPQT